MSTIHEKVMGSVQLAGRVTRYHTWPMIRKPSTAEHQARVATLYCELWGLPRAEVLFYCLHHDNGELFAGDTPFYAKRAVPMLRRSVNEAEEIGLAGLGVKLPELTGLEFSRFKMADLLEMWETATVEINMGNKYACAVQENLLPTVYLLARELCETNLIEQWLDKNQPEP